MKHGQLKSAVHCALAAGVVAAPGVNAEYLGADTEDTAAQQSLTVTGTRILRASAETASPVTIIAREDIDASGSIAIAELLRSLPANIFGSFRERSGVPQQSASAVDLHGLGSERTLVLLDGRRISSAPQFDAAAQNLNLIPFAAVERVEVLRDGASAIYGSDAIGGVINIILRKDYEGLRIAVSGGRPTQTGGDEEAASVVGGVSSSQGNVTFGVDYSRKAILFSADRDFSKVGLSSFGFPASFLISTPDLSPAGPPGLFRTFQGPDSRCPRAAAPLADDQAADRFLRESPDNRFPDSVSVISVIGGSRCRYNYAGPSADEAAIRRQSVFVNGEFEITDETEFFARAISAQNESFGRYAPPPQCCGSIFLPTMAASNPNNPTQGLQFTLPDLDANFQPVGTSSTYSGPFDVSVLYRNVKAGNRDTFFTDNMLDLLAGVRGTARPLGGLDWEAALQHSRIKTSGTSLGLSSNEALQDALDNGSFDLFGINGPTSTTIASTFLIDSYSDLETRFLGADLTVRFDFGGFVDRAVSWAWGTEYQDFEFTRDFDSIANSADADIAGVEGGVDIRSGRTILSAFGEALIPILENLELNVAVRFDDYNDFGSTTNPKVGLAFRPLKSVLLRAGYGEGFRAPSMDQLHDPQRPGLANFVRDTRRCIEIGDSNNDGIADANQEPDLFVVGHPCAQIFDLPILTGGNPALDAESSDNWTAGVVWSPSSDLSVGADFYSVEIENEISRLPVQSILDCEARGFGLCTALVERDATGQITRVISTQQNVAGRRTKGLDFDGTYRFGISDIGQLEATIGLTHVFEYDFSVAPGVPFSRLDGLLQADTRGLLGLGWQRGNFNGQLNIHYVSTVTDGMDVAFSAWTMFDLQFSWNTAWNGTLTIGARNLGNESPPLDPDFGFPGYTNEFYDVYGRVPFVKYEQDL